MRRNAYVAGTLENQSFCKMPRHFAKCLIFQAFCKKPRHFTKWLTLQSFCKMPRHFAKYLAILQNDWAACCRYEYLIIYVLVAYRWTEESSIMTRGVQQWEVHAYLSRFWEVQARDISNPHVSDAAGFKMIDLERQQTTGPMPACICKTIRGREDSIPHT